MNIQFTTRLFKEGRTSIAQALELYVSSCGGAKDKALANLEDAVRLFLEEAERMGTLDQILDEAGYTRNAGTARRSFIGVQTVSVPLTHAKT